MGFDTARRLSVPQLREALNRCTDDTAIIVRLPKGHPDEPSEYVWLEDAILSDGGKILTLHQGEDTMPVLDDDNYI